MAGISPHQPGFIAFDWGGHRAPRGSCCRGKCSYFTCCALRVEFFNYSLI